MKNIQRSTNKEIRTIRIGQEIFTKEPITRRQVEAEIKKLSAKIPRGEILAQETEARQNVITSISITTIYRPEPKK